jgi:hypothetical protein
MNKFTTLIIVVLILSLVGAAFYWYEWRPQQIVKACNDVANKAKGARFVLGSEKEQTERYKAAFELCTRSKGLE